MLNNRYVQEDLATGIRVSLAKLTAKAKNERKIPITSLEAI